MSQIIHFSIKLLSLLPFRLLYILSDLLFPVLYHVARYRRAIVRQNLTESFPQKPLAEIKKIECRFYHFFIDMVLESCKLYSISPEEMKRHAKFVNAELVDEKLREGKSVSIFIGHYCNWEWISTFGLWTKENPQIVQIYHKLRNENMNKLMLRLRESFGNTSVDMYNTVRFIANAYQTDRRLVVGFIADQSPKKKEVKHFINFLNHRVPTLTGTEKLTKHFGFEALYLGVRRVRRGYYEYEFVSLNENPASLPDFELTALYYQRLEQDINRSPEYYLWTHKRFKHAENIN